MRFDFDSVLNLNQDLKFPDKIKTPQQVQNAALSIEAKNLYSCLYTITNVKDKKYVMVLMSNRLIAAFTQNKQRGNKPLKKKFIQEKMNELIYSGLVEFFLFKSCDGSIRWFKILAPENIKPDFKFQNKDGLKNE